LLLGPAPWGAATAFFLARRKAGDVVLVDRREIESRTSPGGWHGKSLAQGRVDDAAHQSRSSRHPAFHRADRSAARLGAFILARANGGTGLLMAVIGFGLMIMGVCGVSVRGKVSDQRLATIRSYSMWYAFGHWYRMVISG
jgi:hypothetical protein